MIPVRIQMLENCNGLHDLIGTSHPSQRNIPTGYSFGHRHQIRLNSKMIDAKPFPRSPKTTDDFVDDEQNAVGITDLPNNFPILLWRCESPKPLLNGFTDESRYLFRVFKFDDPRDVPRASHVTLWIAQMDRAVVT